MELLMEVVRENWDDSTNDDAGTGVVVDGR